MGGVSSASLLRVADAAILVSGVAIVGFHAWSSSEARLRARERQRLCAEPVYALASALAPAHVVRSAAECSALLLEEAARAPRVVGFDAEWRPVHGSKVALVQLAFPTRVLLLRLCEFAPGESAPLRELLASREVLKVGVGAAHDASRLRRDWGLEVNGVVEVAALLDRSSLRVGVAKPGLKSLCRELLALELPKPRAVTCSDWETRTLSEEQTLYAATDALVSLLLFGCLFSARRSSTQPAALDPVALAFAAQRAAPAEVREFTRGLAHDGPARGAPKAGGGGGVKRQRTARAASEEKDEAERRQQQAQQLEQSRRTKQSRTVSSHTKRLYENCKMLSPDGKLIATTDRRKMDWYLTRGLAKLEAEDTIRLNFEPKGDGSAGDPYYLSHRDNVCVVCGADASQIGMRRHHVVPLEYRRHFPEYIKSHEAHDVLLVCVDCHVAVEAANHRFRQQIAEETGVPLDRSAAERAHMNPHERMLARVRGEASALQRADSRLPEARRRELRASVAAFCEKPEAELTDADIARVANLTTATHLAPGETHGARVVRGMSEEQILAFSRRWRQHFLDEMKPRFLNEHWRVDHHRSAQVKTASRTSGPPFSTVRLKEQQMRQHQQQQQQQQDAPPRREVQAEEKTAQ